MTTEERKNNLSVEIVDRNFFDNERRRWGCTDKSESALFWMGRPVMIDGSKSYAPQLAALVRELLENEFFVEMPNFGAILDSMTGFVGEAAAFDIVKCVSGRWEHVHREEAKDRAAAWTAGRNLLEEIDRINPDSLYRHFYDACGKSFECELDAVLCYGYELGLAAAREGAQV